MNALRETVVGVFHEPTRAQQAVRALKEAGFRDDQIGVIGRDSNAPALDRATGSCIVEGSVVGAATGAGVGALWALGIAAGFLPALGPVVAGGLLVSVLASAGGAGAVGTVVGALVGLGIPEDEATYYTGEFTSGRTVVTVKSEGRPAEAWAILERFGAYRRDPADTPLDTTYADADEAARAELDATTRSFDASRP